MVVSASTNQVWTKITIGSYAHVFCHSESDTSSVSLLSQLVPYGKEWMETSRYEIKFGVEKEERLDIADDGPKQHGLTEQRCR